MSRPLIAFDTETHRIKGQRLAPPLVSAAASAAQADGSGRQDVLYSTGDPEDLDALLDLLLDPEAEHLLIAHNAAYDLAVIAAARPDLFPAIFDVLEQGRVTDTGVREKLLLLADTGDLAFRQLPGGAVMKVGYALTDLEKYRLGIDRSALKDSDEGDHWRINYDQLDGVPVAAWPEDARSYAQDDSVNLIGIYLSQEREAEALSAQRGLDVLKTQGFHTAVSFALYLMTCHGVRVDAAERARIVAMLERELAGEKLQRLIGSKILTPAQPAAPYASGARAHTPDCDRKGGCDCPPKMKAATKASISTTLLTQYVVDLAERLGKDAEGEPRIKLTYNPPSEGEPDKAARRLAEAEKVEDLQDLLALCTQLAAKYGRPVPGGLTTREEALAYLGQPRGTLSLTTEFFEDHAHLDPLLEEYLHRQKLQKLVTTELPRMLDPETGEPAPVVHPNFDVLKATGRTSSFASKLYPSFNGQNVDPRARACYIPRPGYLLFSLDYNQMELGTLAQTCLDLFGHSTMADLINAGTDLHAYLGAQMAHAFDPDFAAWCAADGATSPESVYERFAALKGSDLAEERAFYKHYRTFAKPTDLGYPGGLGAATFVKYAKATFGVIITEAQAKDFKDIWLQTFPEMVEYFNYIKRQAVDPFNGPVRKTIRGEEREVDLYRYTTPMGMLRSGCDYCAAANGMGLQAPSAEGAKTAVFQVVRACFDPSRPSVLSDDEHGPVVRPQVFIHDELVGEIREDDRMHERIEKMMELMVESMRLLTPDVAARAGAALMRRWNKNAEGVYSPDGRLTVWESPV